MGGRATQTHEHTGALTRPRTAVFSEVHHLRVFGPSTLIVRERDGEMERGSTNWERERQKGRAWGKGETDDGRKCVRERKEEKNYMYTHTYI